MASKNIKIPEILPEAYSYEGMKVVRCQQTDGLSITVRVKITTKEEVLCWIDDFQKKNYVTLRIHHSYEEDTQKILFKRSYRCMHNTRPKKGTPHHPKHTNCTAKVIATLKNPNMRRSKDVYLKTYPCEMYVLHTHNHALYSASVLKYRPPAKELQHTFKLLFEKGHSATSALKVFKQNLMEKYSADEYCQIVADGQKCPSTKWVFDLYYSVFKTKYGDRTGSEMMVTLEKFINDYNKKCGEVCAAVQMDDNLAVAICSPIMKRIHESVKSASEVMYVDSSGNMDKNKTRVFLFLCPSCVGALPLGVLFLSSTSEKSFINGLELLKTILPPTCFYNVGFPNVIIAGNSDAERKAFQNCFSGSKLFVCKFHVLQAAMRYFWRTKNGLNKDDRVHVYSLFYKAVNCSQEDEFIKQYMDLLRQVVGNKRIYGYLLDLLSDANSWAMYYRKGWITGHEPNCETTFRILKDKNVFGRKAFSIAQLFDFMTTSFERSYLKKIMDITNGCWKDCKKKTEFLLDDSVLADIICESLGCGLYKVVSEPEEYVVNFELELCTCSVGNTGLPCKHQFAVATQYDLESQEFQPTYIDSNFKNLFYKVLTGEDCPLNGAYDEISLADDAPDEILKSLPSDFLTQPKCTNAATVRTRLSNIVETIMSKYENQFEQYEKPIEMFLQNFDRCTTDSSLMYALRTFGEDCAVKMPIVQDNTDECAGVQPTKRPRLADHCYCTGVETSEISEYIRNFT